MIEFDMDVFRWDLPVISTADTPVGFLWELCIRNHILILRLMAV
jgi:hypothetical protein